MNYNEKYDAKLDVVTLPCGLVGGETLLSCMPFKCGNNFCTPNREIVFCRGIKTYARNSWISVPLVHIDDVCDAHIFCTEKPSTRGRFLFAAANQTMSEIETNFRENYPEYCKIIDEE